MSRQTQMNISITDSQEGETMHLFDAGARKEEALCRAETSVDDRTSLQYYAKRRTTNHLLAVGRGRSHRSLCLPLVEIALSGQGCRTPFGRHPLMTSAATNGARRIGRTYHDTQTQPT